MVNLTACEIEYARAREKYGSASIAEPDAAVVTRRWRVFLVVEVILLASAVVLFMFARTSEWTLIVFGVLGAWLVFSLPVAGLYLIGKPPVMPLDPYCSSPETQAMERDVRLRAPLSDDEFYGRFYAESRIQRETIHRIRVCLRKQIDPVVDRLVPSDYLPLLWDGLDFADLLDMLAQEFRAVADFDGSFDGTLDSLIRLFDGVIQSGAVIAEESSAGM